MERLKIEGQTLAPMEGLSADIVGLRMEGSEGRCT